MISFNIGMPSLPSSSTGADNRKAELQRELDDFLLGVGDRPVAVSWDGNDLSGESAIAILEALDSTKARLAPESTAQLWACIECLTRQRVEGATQTNLESVLREASFIHLQAQAGQPLSQPSSVNTALNSDVRRTVLANFEDEIGLRFEGIHNRDLLVQKLTSQVASKLERKTADIRWGGLSASLLDELLRELRQMRPDQQGKPLGLLIDTFCNTVKLEKFDGNVPNALRRLLTAVLGTGLDPRIGEHALYGLGLYLSHVSSNLADQTETRLLSRLKMLTSMLTRLPADERDQCCARLLRLAKENKKLSEGFKLMFSRVITENLGAPK
ncbi:MAG TPA: hypothetical protein VEC06_16280 [Paucimonas sp.]|nr:hypothetical protein [Paucimonas sp.]